MMICNNPQVFKLFNLCQLRVFQKKKIEVSHNFAFLEVEVREIRNTPLMQTIQVLLKQFKITSRVNSPYRIYAHCTRAQQTLTFQNEAIGSHR